MEKVESAGVPMRTKREVSKTDTMEEKREELLENMSLQISDELKNAIDVSYELSKKRAPNPFLSFSSSSDPNGDTF